ncbi:MAG: O-antigen ligase family protein [Anaerolineae bacterium]
MSLARLVPIPDFMVTALQSPDNRIRVLSTLALCIAVALPVGAIIGLLGAQLGIAALLAMLIAYLMLRSLMFSMVVLIGVILLLPFAALPIDIGFAPTFLDLALGAVLFVWIARYVAHQDREFLALSPALGVLVFVVLAVFSSLAGLGHAPLTANVLRHLLEILLSILLFVVTTNAVRTPGQLRILVTVLVLAGATAAFIGIVLYILPEELTVRLLSVLRVVRYPSGTDVLRYIEDDPARALRATSTSVDPNVLGGALIFVTTIATAQFFDPHPVLPRRWLAAVVALMGVCMILTFSRGSFFGLAVAIFFLALLRYRKLLWIGLAVLVVILVLPFTQPYVDHYLSGLRGEDLATQMRFGEYKDALILIGRYPWFGVGFSGTPEVDTYLGVSNVYLLIAENMGIIGLGAFLATLYAHLAAGIGALRSIRTRARVSATTIGLYLAIVGAMAGGMLDHYLFNLVFPHASSLLWLTMGLGAASLHMDLSTEPASAPTRPLIEEMLGL